jgi:hypothetical protein
VSSLASESSSGIVIKKLIAILLLLTVCMPISHAETTSSLAKAKPTLSPSPSPVWPPKGFAKSKDGNAFIKIPKPKELVGLASNDKVLTKALAQTVDGVPVCEKYSCGAVQVASVSACTWWVVTAYVKGATSPEDKTVKLFGTLRTTIGKTAAKKYSTILLVSSEPIELRHSVSNIKAVCRTDVPTEKVPGTTYTVAP